MKIVRILDKTPVLDADGKWNIYCQVLRGSTYQYGAVVCETRDDAFALQERQIIDTGKYSFEHRIKNL